MISSTSSLNEYCVHLCEAQNRFYLHSYEHYGEVRLQIVEHPCTSLIIILISFGYPVHTFYIKIECYFLGSSSINRSVKSLNVFCRGVNIGHLNYQPLTNNNLTLQEEWYTRTFAIKTVAAEEIIWRTNYPPCCELHCRTKDHHNNLRSKEAADDCRRITHLIFEEKV